MEKLLREKSLHTVCRSAVCPNMGQCFARGTATFMILGDICTRRCTFCAVQKGVPCTIPDADEPEHVRQAARTLGLTYVVITSVTRDDLPDGGASQFALTVAALHRENSETEVEILIPDFLGDRSALAVVVRERPEVINHNVETVPRLYGTVRPQASYRRSLELLSAVKDLGPGTVTKSGLMVGLGETRNEIVEVMRDLREVHCNLLTIGQYLQPSDKHHPVLHFVPPEEFEEYRRIGMDMGFDGVASGPLVRSSYRAADLYKDMRESRNSLS